MVISKDIPKSDTLEQDSSQPSISSTSTNSTTKTSTTKRRRDPLSPKPILDEKLLRDALSTKGILIKDFHLQIFYQQLHKLHYPPLPTFVKQYYKDDATSTHKQLPKAFLNFLSDPNNDFATITSTIQHRPTSLDGTTTKLAVRLQDDHLVESVLMRHVSESGSRATLCVSSQVGCAMGCTFCATGTMGIRGNLTAGEILEQMVHAGQILREESEAHRTGGGVVVDYDDGGNGKDNEMKEDVPGDMITSANGVEKKKSEQQLDTLRNIVFMGMGEPLNNYSNVIAACRAMIDRRRWNLAHGRVTVSTVGVTPKMRQLTRDLPEVNLALSLHAPNQPMREAIVPTAKMYPIEDMVEALDEHMMVYAKGKGGYNSTSNGDNGGTSFGVEERKTASKRKRAMIEYVMLEGDTSSIECAHQLGRLCKNRQLVVNLIPYNQTDVKDKLSCPSEEHMKEFQRIVKSYGSFCFIRRTMGADIAGACGQLVVKQEQKKQQEEQGLRDIEDGPFTGRGPQDGIKSRSRENSYNLRETKSLERGKSSESESEKKKNSVSEMREKEYEKIIKPLAIVTAIATSCFAISLVMLHTQQRRR